MCYFNPRSPRGERPQDETAEWFTTKFQSTLPSRGATLAFDDATIARIFQSTLPSRGATQRQRYADVQSDDFNPRSPRGERRAEGEYFEYWKQFQSTLPSRGATASANQASAPSRFQSTLPSRGATFIVIDQCHVLLISIHAPLAGSDDGKDGNRIAREEFQSTLPSRGATMVDIEMRLDQMISIHAPLAGSDRS